MNWLNLTPAQLRKAATLKEQIETLQKQLESITGDTSISSPVMAGKAGKRKMSASAIAKIRTAAKARWAAIKAKSGPVANLAASKPVRKKRVISAAGIARIKAAQKARWAAIKAKAAAPSAKAVAKKGRSISPAARAKMAAAAKAMWAQRRAAQAKKK